jgi:hypothetical protein
MIKEAIEKILSLGMVEQFDIDGHKYTSKGLHPVKFVESIADPLNINTLTGIVDYIKANHDKLELKTSTLHIFSHDCVSLISKVIGDVKQRTIHINSDCSNILEKGFEFGHWHSIHSFIIALQSGFIVNDDLKMVLEFVSDIKAEEGQDYKDTGVAQSVTARKSIGSSLIKEADVPNPVALKPFRTFLEVEQPESSFVFRLQSAGEGKPPLCALFEASGGMWKLQAIQSIKVWLKAKKLNVTIIA